MKITITAIIALCACALSSLGQNTYTIKGVTVDTTAKTKLTTTVTVLNAKDSILQRYTHTATDGSFTMSGLPAGKYLLWVTYPDYASYEEAFTLEGANREHNFGNINMQDRAKLLNEVVIKGEIKAIKIKGDTTEYNAKAFVIQPNDKVEDLLKQLPDVHVDKDGKITAQGETVPKVLVDGEEFFGDDPLLVTRNLRADMVDKVQIYNKKSDQAVFTGIDDGKTTKTINITLREDKKTGMFGKGIVGGGNDGYYESQLMFNKFKGKYKLSIYGTAANNGKTGLGYQDASRLGASSSNIITFDDGGIGIVIGAGGGDALDNANYNGQGLPVARTAGIHYDTKWGEDKQSINTNYKLGDMSLNIATTTNSQQNLPTGSINRVSSSNADNHTFRQKADVIYQNNIDANTSVKLTVDGTQRSTDNKSTVTSETTNGTGALLNTENRTDNSTAEQKLFNATFLFTKKLKKPSRTISWNISEAFSQTDSKRFLNSIINTPAVPDVTTAQYQPTTSISSVLNSNITFTEPITPKLALTFNYGFGINNGTSEREAYNQSAPGVYDVFDPIYSNNFKLNQLTNQLGAMFNYRAGGDKVILTFGTRATSVNFKQINQYTNQVFKRDFINWSPQAVFRYRINTSSNYTFNYSGNATQPTIDQIQPIRVNTDLQNITIGNANLEPQFRHNFSTSYTSSKTVSAQYISFGGSYSFTTNVITTNNVTDITTGRSITQFVNFTDKNPYNYNVRASFSRRILGISAGLSASHNGNVSYSYINGLASTNSNRSNNLTLDLQANKPNKYSIYAYGGPSYSFLKNELPTSVLNNNSMGYTVYSQGTLYLPGKFQIASDFNYNYQGATQTVPALVTRMWNGSISKTFLKGDNLKFSISGNNLLNQDQIRRTPTATGLIQSSTNTIRRYFMLTVSWDFTKFGTAPAQN